MKKSLFANSIYNIIYNLANVILPLITSAYVSRVLLPEKIGLVAYVNTNISYFVTFAALGLPSYGIKAISNIKKDNQKLNKVYTELFIINFFSTTLAIIVFIITLIILQTVKNNYLLYIALGIQLFFCYLNIDWLYKGLEDYKYITIRSIIIKVLSVISLFIFVRTENDFIKYAFIISLALGLNYCFNIIHSKKYVHFDFNNIKVKRHLKPVLYLAISVFFASVYSKIDITMLGMMTNDYVVGIYSNSHKIINMVITACVACTAVFLPRISYLYTQNKDKFKEVINYGVDIISYISFPATIGLLILANNLIIFIYGDAFEAASISLKIFCALIVIKSFGDLICHQAVIASNKEKILIPTALIAMAINITLNLLLIPILQEKGATIASVISEITLNLTIYLYIRKSLNLKITNQIKKDLVSATIMGVVVYLITKLNISNTFICIIGIIIGITIYLFSNFVLKNELQSKILTRALVYFKELLNRKK